MNPLAELRELLRYLAGKRSELEDLDVKDAVMAKAILDIHRTRTHKRLVSVPLFALRPIHTLDRENAAAATQRRIEALAAERERLLGLRTLTCETLAQVLPSVSWIKVVEKAPGTFLAFEGNGRIAAMQAVFSRADGMLVEVEQYLFRNPAKIVRRLDRVRRLNGLKDPTEAPTR